MMGREKEITKETTVVEKLKLSIRSCLPATV
jgi:hypothetical protein